jgi:hypothetical protein
MPQARSDEERSRKERGGAITEIEFNGKGILKPRTRVVWRERSLDICRHEVKNGGKWVKDTAGSGDRRVGNQTRGSEREPR